MGITGAADPTAIIQDSWSKMVPSAGIDWGWFTDDPAKQTALLAKLHACIVY